MWNRVETTWAQETHSEPGAYAPARWAAVTDRGKATLRRPQTVVPLLSSVQGRQLS